MDIYKILFCVFFYMNMVLHYGYCFCNLIFLVNKFPWMSSCPFIKLYDSFHSSIPLTTMIFHIKDKAHFILPNHY